MTFALSFGLEGRVRLKASESVTHSREDLLARFNDFCGDLTHEGESSFFGVTEGVLLAEEAHERGYETESWVLDEGMAPHERDWLSQEARLEVTAYFKDRASAEEASRWLGAEYALTAEPRLVEEQDQDWNATWKAAFTGIDVNENLKVLPPWSTEWESALQSGNTRGILAINPGAGFGTGTHETTQLCLGVLSGLGDLAGKRVLDFGSGSGILGIAAALQGARVDCVEIDPLANDNARENASLNRVSDRIRFSETIPDELKDGKVDILIANILRPILLRFAPELKSCLKPRSELVLSGLIESDLDPVVNCYQGDGAEFQLNRYEKNEWRALWLRRGSN